MSQFQSNLQTISNEEFVLFRSFLKDVSGIDLTQNKTYLVTSRLSSVMRAHNISDYKKLLEIIKQPAHADLRDEVIDAMTTNETNWFRDIHPFNVLTQKILTELHQKKASRVKIWSAACSSGQEPNSISICVSEFLEKNRGAFPGGVSITGTDISSSMLQKATQSIYDPLELARGLSEERKAKFFDKLPDSEKMQLKENERKRVSYRYLNLLKPYTVVTEQDIIFCRNVLIYFAHDTKIEIINKLTSKLVPGGYLLLGASEALPSDCSANLTMINCQPGIVYQKNS